MLLVANVNQNKSNRNNLLAFYYNFRLWQRYWVAVRWNGFGRCSIKHLRLEENARILILNAAQQQTFALNGSAWYDNLQTQKNMLSYRHDFTRHSWSYNLLNDYTQTNLWNSADYKFIYRVFHYNFYVQFFWLNSLTYICFLMFTCLQCQRSIVIRVVTSAVEWMIVLYIPLRKVILVLLVRNFVWSMFWYSCLSFCSFIMFYISICTAFVQINFSINLLQNHNFSLVLPPLRHVIVTVTSSLQSSVQLAYFPWFHGFGLASQTSL